MTSMRLVITTACVLLLTAMTGGPVLCFWFEQGTAPLARATGSATGSSGNVVYVPVGEDVTFSDNNSSDMDQLCDPALVPDDIESWEWDFRDGTPKAYGKTVKHAFERTGVYVVTLTIDDGPPDVKKHFDEGPVTTDEAHSVTVKVWDVTISNCGSGWIPADGDTLSFTLKINPSDVTGQFQVNLDYVSSWTGTCSNAGTGTSPDITITPGQAGWNIAGSTALATSERNTATISVTCHDYGACGVISAKALRAVWRDAYIVGSDPKVYAVSMPVDDNGNQIADASPHDKRVDGTAGYMSDGEENTPLGLNTGDGFSRFDEYRGFMLGGAHTRTDANTKKDVYIRDEDGLGLGSFGALGLETHTINDDEWDSASHAVNFNGSASQCGILLQDGAWLDNQYAGKCYLRIGGDGPGMPCDIARVEIYPQWIRWWSEPNRWDKTIVDPDDAAITSQVIAHELAHAVSIHHHDPITGGNSCNMRYPCPKNAGEVVDSFCTSLPGCIRKTQLH